MANYKAVGRISGSPLNGLCERMCIRADCVIDACRIRRSSQTATVTLTGITEGAVPPFNFVGGQSFGGSVFTVESSYPVQDGCNRVTGTLRVPVVISFTDSRGVCCRGEGVVSVNRDLVLKVPESDFAEYEFTGNGNFICVSGAFLMDKVVSLNYCIVETYRTVMRADILVPTYGFAVYPDCRECDGCNALMNSDLFDENQT